MKLILVILAFISTNLFGNEFIEKNLKTFVEFKLDNGVPVYLKQMKGDVAAIGTVFLGGMQLASFEKAGLEKAMFTLMNYESKKYSELKKRSILQNTTAAISSETNLDYSSYSLKVINKYFDEVFDVYEDLLMNPTFSEKYYEEVITDLKNKLIEDRASDGMARVGEVLNLDFFEGHKYKNFLDTPESISKITLNDIKKYYEENIKAERMAIMVAGDFSVDKLKEKLNAKFGKISKGNFKIETIIPHKISEKHELILNPFKGQTKDTSFVRCNFVAPHPTSDDYFATVLATKVGSNVIEEIVRTKHGMVYSAWMSMRQNNANYASLIAFKTNNIEKVYSLIKDSINIVSEGKAVGSGSELVSISDVLDFYKTSYETEYFNELQSSAQIAATMALSYATSGDPKNYLYAVDKIKDVSARQVKNATIKYFRDAPRYCAIVANPEVINNSKNNLKSYSETNKVVELQ